GAAKKLDEVYFALVECSESVHNGKKISADVWMNWVEYISFLGFLYVTPDRQIEYTIVTKNGPKNYNPNCVVRPTRMLNLPMLTGISAGIQEMPAKEPPQGSKEYNQMRKNYRLMQTAYLALRGPYSAGE